MNNNTNFKTIILIIVPLVLALLSAFVVSKPMTSTSFHAKTIESLDEKQSTILELTAASTAASAAISAIPSDACTPIAEKIADLSSYFLIVLCAVFLEKYMVTVTGYATFVVLIPLACILFSLNVYFKRDFLNKLIAKLLLFAVALSIIIPLSVVVSNIVENTYQESIESTISDAQSLTENLDADSDSNESFLEGFTSKVKDSVTGAITKLETTFNNFIEALAVMIVTSCIIPLLVLFFFVWLIRVILGVEINIPKFPRKRKHNPVAGITDEH